ncbi:tetratricopeptide repeat protein [Nostoc sp. FACHB-152]|uniref:tetratricopeptide repeat-containing sulfotransferase family protein n=1 Tax=unclassified Nostoc TaxID=2593658 RepID=UPI001685EBC4|nr:MULTISPECIES: tetratricopeptide repeat protein [unclassified Nostoc]MBD2451336.1 tetratricopeptide repeat protein [Nostoc sp. FACHB-152]MBD2466297.1 tetratricopeptide repeat protein [Nostoc sp. FACHB-145]
MKYQEALIDHYRKALNIKPNNLEIYNKLAELYYEQGELEKALEFCQLALHIEPNLALSPKILAKLLQILGFEGEEAYIFQKILQRESNITTFYHAFGKTLLSLDKVKNITDAKTWRDAVTLGHTFKENKQLDKAIFAYIKALEITPILGWPYTELESIINYYIAPSPDLLERITNLYKQAIEKRLNNLLAYVILGDMLTKQGKLDEAIANYKTASSKITSLDKNYNTKSKNLNKSYKINFLIIGVGKGGTTSLYFYMCQHPQIIPPIKKELHFFNSNFKLGFDWYLSQFPPLPTTGDFLTGEATPWYLGTDGAEEKVFQLLPNIKLIVVLRNPINRAISHYYMHFNVTEKRSLEEAINSEIEILRNVKDIKNISEISSKYWQTEQGYLWFGLYTYFLEKWMATFSKEQFLILSDESLNNKTEQTMKQVFDFLEIPNFSLENYPKYNSSSYPKVNDDLRQKLTDFFQPHNQRLENYLGIKFNWS